MRLTLNGRHTEVPARPGASLLDLLREECGLRSMKDGCAPEGSCGACTVIVGGRAVVSCAQPAGRFEDRDVLTLEGLSAEARAAWADAFVGAGAEPDREHAWALRLAGYQAGLRDAGIDLDPALVVGSALEEQTYSMRNGYESMRVWLPQSPDDVTAIVAVLYTRNRPTTSATQESAVRFK